MRFIPLLALLSTAGLGTGVALADEEEADTCLRTKIWSGYNEGWAVRTATSASLASSGSPSRTAASALSISALSATVPPWTKAEYSPLSGGSCRPIEWLRPDTAAQ